MSAGPLALALEPEGYFYAKEEGAYMVYDGDDLASRGAVFAEDGFYKPPGKGGWFTAQPLQLNEDWYKDSRMDDHLLHIADWTFDSGGQTPVETHHLNEDKLSGGVYEFPWDKYIVFNTKVGTGELDSLVNIYTATGGKRPIKTVLETDAKFYQLPDDMHVRAYSNVLLPEGKTPVFRVSSSPKPEDVVIVGFGQFAIVIVNDRLAVMETLDSGVNWILVDASDKKGDFVTEEKFSEFHNPNKGAWSTGATYSQTVQRNVQTVEFAVMGVGTDEVAIIGKKGTFSFRSRTAPRTPIAGTNCVISLGVNVPIKEGRWWVATKDNYQLFMQVERMAYQEAEHIRTSDPWPPDSAFPEEVKRWLAERRKRDITFDFSDEYKPTADPKTAMNCLVHGPDVTTTLDTDTGKIRHVCSNGEAVEFEIYGPKGDDPNSSDQYEVWASNGQNSKGRLHFKITPSDDFEMAPQIKNIVVGFDTVLAPRIRQFPSGQTLVIEGTDKASVGDSKLARFSCSTSYDELLDKRFEATVYQNVIVNDSGSEVPITTDWPNRGIHLYERRENFPAEIREDVFRSGAYDVVRIRVWVKKITRGDIKWIDFDGDGIAELAVREYTVVGLGLGCRLDRPWLFTSTVQAPENGARVTHTDFVRKCFKCSGIDPDDVVLFLAKTDFTEDERKKYLPGDVNTDAATLGQRVKSNAFQPRWEDTKAEVAQNIGDSWSGYRLVERMTGQCTYFPDEITEVFFAANPQILAIFRPGYSMTNLAKPMNYYLEKPAPTYEAMPVQGNAVRMIGVDEKNEEFQIIGKMIDTVDPTAVGPPLTTLPDNFVGDWKTVVFKPQWVISQSAAMNVVEAMLTRLALRADALMFSIPNAPWDMLEVNPSNIEVGPLNPTGVRNPLGSFHDLNLDVGDACYVVNYGKHIIFHAEFLYEGEFQQVTNFVAKKFPIPLMGRLGAG